MKQKIGCVLMAAGNCVRFGKNKLLSTIDNKSIIDIALDNIPQQKLYSVVVVSQYDSIIKKAKEHNFLTIKNNHPDLGISYTIKLGLSITKDCDAILFMVADQPMLKKSTVENMIDFYQSHANDIISLSFNKKRGNPCIFPKRFYNQLESLVGDIGGNVIIKEHYDCTKLFEADNQNELFDIDTKNDLDNLKKLK